MRSQKIVFDNTKKRGLSEALGYVSRGWFPINVQLLKRIKDRLAKGEYEEGWEGLLSDLKSDLSLFTWSLRRLSEVVDKDACSLPPIEALRIVDKEAMLRIFSMGEEEISSHKIDPSMKPQMLCLRQSLISTATSEALAERMKVDTELAFTCSSVRQLGVNLIAWNYPRIFSKALTTLPHSNETLDAALLKVLGYSPLQLGFRASLEWNTSDDVRHALGEEIDRDVSGKAERLREICELGEAFAQVQDPEHFPSMARQYDDVMGRIEQHLGPEAIAGIRAKIDRFASVASEAVAGLVRIDPWPERQLRNVNAHLAEKKLERNHYVLKCPEETQPLFRMLYESLGIGGSSSAAINILVSQIIPALKFTRGCIYLIDPQKGLAVPRLRIGDEPLSRYRPLRSQDTGETNHPVVMALSYTAPIVQENVFLHGDQVTHVTGVFGNQDRTGVLYLEMSKDLRELPDRQMPLLFFKAIRECLRDCLGMV